MPDTKVIEIERTEIWNARGGKKLISKGAKVELLPHKPSIPDGALGTCLTKQGYLTILGRLRVRGPYTVTRILRASNSQVLLCFSIKEKEVRLRSIYFFS